MSLEKGEIPINKETIITAIVALLVAIFDLLKVFNIYIPVDNDFLYSLVTIVVGAVVYWRNQSWTVEGWTGTLIGREMKAKRGHEAETVDEPKDGEIA